MKRSLASLNLFLVERSGRSQLLAPLARILRHALMKPANKLVTTISASEVEKGHFVETMIAPLETREREEGHVHPATRARLILIHCAPVYNVVITDGPVTEIDSVL